MTDPNTTIQAQLPNTSSDRLYLLVLGETSVDSQPLPESGDLIIGRSERCDVRVQDTSISRQHAILRVGDDITLEDLGSVNGTSVGDQKLEQGAPRKIATNEVFTLGTVTLVVQKRSASIRSRRLWSHDYFEGRVAEECARAERSSSRFGVLRVQVGGDPEPASVQQPLASVLREIDVIGQYGPNEYEILLLDATTEEATVVASRLAAALERAGVGAAIGRASFPEDGRNPDKLIGRARPTTTGKPSIGERSVVVKGEKMQNLYRLAERVAKGTINVLILGETGVGKQVLAENIHRMSPRGEKPFLELNCSAFSENLLESELFGYEKGAFTGATQTKQGLLETANGGTVFLDEIGDMAVALQAKLLRVIESRKVMRVGGLKTKAIDVRFVSATNRELEADVMRGTFRQDLYFRINGVTLNIPALRERPDEIAGLSETFASEAAASLEQDPPTISSAALKLLESYSWPGNIRELRNVIERAVLLCLDSVITEEQLPVEKMATTFATPMTGTPGWRQASAPGGALLSSDGAASGSGSASPTSSEPESAKRERILAALMSCGGNNTEAAKLLGVSRRTLGKWLEAYNIPRPRKKRSGAKSDE